jgi:6-phosphogluconolactonase (cycloisomerase 2 family)
MTIKFRVLLILMVGLATLWMSGCNHYTCGLTFGASTCGTSSPSGISTTTGSGTASAFVFAIDTAGTIDSYTLNNTAVTFAATASYTPPTVPASDGGRGMVVAQSQFLYAGFGVTNQLFGWAIDSTTGALTSVTGSPYTATFMAAVPENEQAMITNPAGSLLFIADAAPAEIWVYQIGSDGSLTAATGSPFSTGSLVPGGLAIDGLGKYLYVTQNFSDNTGEEIGAYAIGTTGSLTLVSGSPFLFPMGQVQGEPTGKYLIGTTGNAQAVSGVDLDQLYVFSIGTTGALTQVATTTTVNSPFRIAVQPNSTGNLVYSFGLNSDATAFNPPEGYQIDASTGALTAVANSPFSNAAIGDWGQFDQSGANLFLLGSVVTQGTNSVTDNIGALAVGSGGALTEPTTGITFATPGFWAVTDPK